MKSMCCTMSPISIRNDTSGNFKSAKHFDIRLDIAKDGYVFQTKPVECTKCMENISFFLFLILILA